MKEPNSLQNSRLQSLLQEPFVQRSPRLSAELADMLRTNKHVEIEVPLYLLPDQ